METEAGARQVLTAVRDTRASDADRMRLTTIILKSASDAARHILEDMMTTMEWKDEWVENYFKEIRELAVQRARERV